MRHAPAAGSPRRPGGKGTRPGRPRARTRAGTPTSASRAPIPFRRGRRRPARVLLRVRDRVCGGHPPRRPPGPVTKRRPDPSRGLRRGEREVERLPQGFLPALPDRAALPAVDRRWAPRPRARGPRRRAAGRRGHRPRRPEHRSRPACLGAVARYAVVVNGATADIRERRVSRQLVRRGDGFSGPVLVKSELSCAGAPERRLEQRAAAAGRPVARLRHPGSRPTTGTRASSARPSRTPSAAATRKYAAP